jgi:hypothetical protein
VSADQIKEMGEKNIILVVTEWAKQHTDSYKDAANVYSLKYFSNFLQELKTRVWVNGE